MKPILPGSTIGILGGGQLARMLAIEGQKMGYKILVFNPTKNCPALSVAHEVIVGSFSDVSAVKAFAKLVDVITFEFESVPVDALKSCLNLTPMHPDLHVFETVQDRIREKSFLKQNNLPVANFEIIDGEALTSSLQFPCVLKTAHGGYDGKGQKIVKSKQDLQRSWNDLNRQPCTLEEFVDLKSEISVIVARSENGEIASLGPIENQHKNHILDYSIYPAQISAEATGTALELATKIAHAFDLIGLICIEFFLTAEEQILINEIAPRTHNSGHLSIEGFSTNQFEQQIRAICGLKLGEFSPTAPQCAMINILGDSWNESHAPDWEALFSHTNLKLHLYGKDQARPGRKMGHVTLTGTLRQNLLDQIKKIKQAL